MGGYRIVSQLDNLFMWAVRMRSSTSCIASNKGKYIGVETSISK